MKAVIPALTALMLAAGPAAAADLGGNCCADLEDRIAELEATTARKGHRKVSLTIQGQVNKAVLLWDDSAERNAYVVGNKNDQSNFSLTGDAEISKGLKAGYDITIRLRDDLSDDADQDNTRGSGDPFQVWQMHWWIESETLGKVSLGKASRVTDTAPESDLSETGVAGYAGVQDIGGAFSLRSSNGALTGLAWGDVYNHFNGDTANVVRYDTPIIAGFTASASWGEDDIWDVGLRYDGEGGGFKMSAAIAYTEITDAPGEFADLDQSTLVGSVAVLHEKTGLNALVSFGHRQFSESVIDTDGVARTPQDAKFIYAKLGWIAQMNSLGPTAFYGEYGWFKDYVSALDDTVDEDGNGIGDGSDIAASLGGARIAGNTAQVWGAGLVQHIEAAEMQIYLGYRLHESEFDLRDAGGVPTAGNKIENFHTLIVGSKIAF